jgi:tRNA-specific 2-thiouridylase
VIANFVSEYLAGRTPIPCTHCNGEVKFATLLERAAGLAAPWLATGHYARVERDETSGRWLLKRGIDPGKDQAYFLFSLTQEQLARAVFPVGSWTKPQVRAYARARGLPVADKRDSHEICFVPDGNYAAFVARQAGPATPGSGLVTDTTGRPLGHHGGIHRFTVGQRKGLGLSASAPLYVVRLDASTNRVVVGPRAALERTRFSVREVNWMAGAAPGAPIRAAVQVRHRHAAIPATVVAHDTRATVTLDQPQIAVAPGQAAAFFDGDVVLGGGWIDDVGG